MAAMAEKRQANLPAVFEHYNLPECTEGLFKAHCKHCNKIFKLFLVTMQAISCFTM